MIGRSLLFFVSLAGFFPNSDYNYQGTYTKLMGTAILDLRPPFSYGLVSLFSLSPGTKFVKARSLEN